MLENEPLQCDIHSCVSLISHRSWLFPTLAFTEVGRVVLQFNTPHRCRMAGFSSRFATWLIKAVFSGMDYSPPALSSYRHARFVECGIDTQAGNKKRLSCVMLSLILRYVNFMSCLFCSLSHKPLLITQYSVNNKRLKNERNIQIVIFFVCYMYTVMAYFNPPLSFQS